MFLLDSSAWLAHLFGESGADQVSKLFDDSRSGVYISALSIPEVYGRLRAIEQTAHWADVWKTYRLLFSKVIPVDEKISHQAITLREATTFRLPTVDGLIAATAVVHDLTLVHRDSHFASIPSKLLFQTQLPDK